MSIIIDLNVVCIVCLRDDGGDLQSVFAASVAEELTIAEKIARCSELRPQCGNTILPDKICSRCLEDLAATWRFRQNCATANSVFHSLNQQEEDVDAQLELETQNLKVPSSLKIKRLQSETKTYLVELGHDISRERVVEEFVDEELHVDDNNEVETADSLDVIEELEEETMHESIGEKEELEFDDYYEAEEILEEEEVEEGFSVERVLKEEEVKEENEITTVKVKNSGTRKSARMADRNPVTVDKAKIKIETDDAVQENVEVVAHGRNKKPGKSNSTVKTNNTTVTQKKVHEKENRVQTTNTVTSQLVATTVTKAKTSNAQAISIPGRPRKNVQHVPMKICEICGNVYKYQHALNAHMRRHTNDRQFGCELCDKAFVCNVELRRHMRVHTGHKPYACSYCDRRFSDFGSRRKHERTHTGERPYCCSTCGKAFAYAHVLSVHLLTHTGEKKFQCNQCGKGFTKKAYLVSHMQLHARANNVGFDDGNEFEQQRQEAPQIVTIKTEALKDCVFTTEYVISQEGEELDEVQSTIMHDSVKLEKNKGYVTEEHLEDSETSEFTLDTR